MAQVVSTDYLGQQLKEMQNNIDFNTHSSTAVFSKIVENTRKYCMAETKKISEKKKKTEKQALQELINASDTLNATTPPIDRAVRNYEEAQERFQLQLDKRQQAASDTNFTNFATLGERKSRERREREKGLFLKQ